MNTEFIQLASFANKVRKLGLNLEDVRAIELAIMDDPDRYPVIAGTGGLRKMRFSPQQSSSGKSGGIRVCYFVVVDAAHVYLVTAYGKNEKENLTALERNAIGMAISAIKKTYQRNG